MPQTSLPARSARDIQVPADLRVGIRPGVPPVVEICGEIDMQSQKPHLLSFYIPTAPDKTLPQPTDGSVGGLVRVYVQLTVLPPGAKEGGAEARVLVGHVRAGWEERRRALAAGERKGRARNGKDKGQNRKMPE